MVSPAWGAVALLVLSLILLLSSADSQAWAAQTATCSPGGIINGVELLWIKFDADTGTCTYTENNVNPPDPANGVELIMNPGNVQLDLSASRYENGAFVDNVAGSNWAITNYSGTRIDAPNYVQFLDNIPTTGLDSTISVSLILNGTPVMFEISGVVKVDGVKDTTYGLVTVTFEPQTASNTAADKSKITDHCFPLSTRLVAACSVRAASPSRC